MRTGEQRVAQRAYAIVVTLPSNANIASFQSHESEDYTYQQTQNLSKPIHNILQFLYVILSRVVDSYEACAC